MLSKVPKQSPNKLLLKCILNNYFHEYIASFSSGDMIRRLSLAGRIAAGGINWKEARSFKLSGRIPKRRILLATTWRSGSTFLGELLNRFPGTFYTYEPLVYFDKIDRMADNQERIKFLSQMLQCNYTQGENY